MKKLLSLTHMGAARSAAAWSQWRLLCLRVGRRPLSPPPMFRPTLMGAASSTKPPLSGTARVSCRLRNLHQASLLTSQLLTHVDKATQQLADARSDAARAEIEKAQSAAQNRAWLAANNGCHNQR